MTDSHRYTVLKVPDDIQALIDRGKSDGAATLDRVRQYPKRYRDAVRDLTKALGTAQRSTTYWKWRADSADAARERLVARAEAAEAANRDWGTKFREAELRIKELEESRKRWMDQAGRRAIEAADLKAELEKARTAVVTLTGFGGPNTQDGEISEEVAQRRWDRAVEKSMAVFAPRPSGDAGPDPVLHCDAPDCERGAYEWQNCERSDCPLKTSGAPDCPFAQPGEMDPERLSPLAAFVVKKDAQIKARQGVPLAQPGGERQQGWDRYKISAITFEANTRIFVVNDRGVHMTSRDAAERLRDSLSTTEALRGALEEIKPLCTREAAITAPAWKLGRIEQLVLAALSKAGAGE